MRFEPSVLHIESLARYAARFCISSFEGQGMLDLPVVSPAPAGTGPAVSREGMVTTVFSRASVCPPG